MQLFILPYAGGSARSYCAWPKALETVCMAIPLNTPDSGRPYIDPPEPLTIQDMAQRYAQKFASATSPFCIFGHSMGALVAFETARCLRRMSKPMPELIFASAHRPPHQPMDRELLHTLPDHLFDERLAHYSGTPDEILGNAEMMDFVRPTLRRDFKACETYCFKEGEPLDVRLLSIGGEEDKEVPTADLQGWGKHTHRFLGTRILPGGHFYFRNAFQELIAETSKVIADASKVA